MAWWDQVASTSAQDQFAVCSLPAGATSCSNLKHVAGPVNLTTGPQPFLFIDSEGFPELIINDHNGAAAEQVEHFSTDGGATWSPGTKTGDTTLSSAALDPAIGILFGASRTAIGPPSYNVAGVTSELGVSAATNYVAPFVSSGGGMPSNTASAVSDTASSINVAHAWDSGLSSVAGGAGYAFYSGPALKAQSASKVLSDAGNVGNWTVGTLSDGGRDVSLAGGPKGIFLSEGAGVGTSALPVLRSFTGSGFGVPTAAECGDTARYDAGLQSSNLFEDPASGVLHYLYIEGGSGGVEDIRYTELSGATQSPPVTLAEQSSGGGMGYAVYPRVASGGPGHPGLAVWVNTGPGGGSATVSAAWLPVASLTGCPSTAPPPTVPPPTTPPPPAGTPKPITVTAQLGDQQISLTTPAPNSCNPVKSSLALTLKAQSLAHGKKGSKQKFKQAALYVDKGVAHRHKVKVPGKKHKLHTVTTYSADAITSTCRPACTCRLFT